MNDQRIRKNSRMNLWQRTEFTQQLETKHCQWCCHSDSKLFFFSPLLLFVLEHPCRCLRFKLMSCQQCYWLLIPIAVQFHDKATSQALWADAVRHTTSSHGLPTTMPKHKHLVAEAESEELPTATNQQHLRANGYATRRSTGNNS